VGQGYKGEEPTAEQPTCRSQKQGRKRKIRKGTTGGEGDKKVNVKKEEKLGRDEGTMTLGGRNYGRKIKKNRLCFIARMTEAGAVSKEGGAKKRKNEKPAVSIAKNRNSSPMVGAGYMTNIRKKTCGGRVNIGASHKFLGHGLMVIPSAKLRHANERGQSAGKVNGGSWDDDCLSIDRRRRGNQQNPRGMFGSGKQLCGLVFTVGDKSPSQEKGFRGTQRKNTRMPTHSDLT